MPGDYPPSDIVMFGSGLPSVDIAEAPPWLVPEHLKMDYELFGGTAYRGRPLLIALAPAAESARPCRGIVF